MLENDALSTSTRALTTASHSHKMRDAWPSLNFFLGEKAAAMQQRMCAAIHLSSLAADLGSVTPRTITTASTLHITLVFVEW